MGVLLRTVAGSVTLLGLTACGDFDQAFGAGGFGGPPSGHLVMIGAAPLVTFDTMAFMPDRSFASLVAEHANFETFEARSVANETSMEQLCSPHNAHPDFALLTRSPTLAEIRRCERAGIDISADLLATYRGDWTGFAEFEHVWIVFVPDELDAAPLAAKAVRALRYEFGALIEGTEYAEVFEARRG